MARPHGFLMPPSPLRRRSSTRKAALQEQGQDGGARAGPVGSQALRGWMDGGSGSRNAAPPAVGHAPRPRVLPGASRAHPGSERRDGTKLGKRVKYAQPRSGGSGPAAGRAPGAGHPQRRLPRPSVGLPPRDGPRVRTLYLVPAVRSACLLLRFASRPLTSLTVHTPAPPHYRGDVAGPGRPGRRRSVNFPAHPLGIFDFYSPHRLGESAYDARHNVRL